MSKKRKSVRKKIVRRKAVRQESGIRVQKTDREITPRRGETVAFEVVCQPRSGAGIQQMMGELTVDTLDRSSPEERTLADVARKLQEFGFRTYIDDAGSGVSAEGPYDLFERAFQTSLRKRQRTLKTESRTHTFEFFDTRKSATDPNVASVPGALLISIQRPPIFMQSPLPSPVGYFHLRVPSDVAMLTGASATHRRRTPAGQRATGTGVRVAMLDTGFFIHPYYQAHGYRLTPVLAPGAIGPANSDPNGHGTGEVANIFACAPDARVFGVKMGLSTVLAFNRAMSLNPQVISCSWGFDLPGVTSLPLPLLPLYLRVLTAVAQGITVVFSGGNGQVVFPAMMPQVIAAGGVYADNNGRLRASNYASSFMSLIFSGRRVPDFCGLVGMQPRGIYIMLPIPRGCDIDRDLGGGAFPNKDGTATNDGWGVFSGTSAAAPQIAGVCALLLQKNPSLTPNQVKAILRATAVDVTVGTSAMGESAGPGTDNATGSGLVNALQGWLSA